MLIFAESLEVAPLVRKVVAKAYQQGSKLVSVLWCDEQLEKIRYEYAPHDSFEEFTTWEVDVAIECIERGDALLTIYGKTPNLLKDQSPDLLSIVNRVKAKHNKPLRIHEGRNTVQWSAVCPPTPDWAIKVFPEEPPQVAVSYLWDAVFKACRLDESDPIIFWQKQIENLNKRKEYLSEKQYTLLQFTGPGTNLKVGLPIGHIWAGGSCKTPRGVSFSPCLPTEEVFTLPHKGKVEGTVTSTKPLSYQGRLIDNFYLTFIEGRVVEFSAKNGQEALSNLLETDENAKFLGEVALVSNQSVISELGLLFLNSMYDENASNHLAFGYAYRYTLKDGAVMSNQEFIQAGGNDSLIHVDFMFGSEEMDVNGIMTDGTVEPIMCKGEWAFEI